MWTRELLKTNAKQVLSRNFWNVFLVCLAANLLINATSKITLEVSEANLDGLAAFVLSVAGLLLAAAAIAWSIFGANPLIVGWKRYMMENRLGKCPFDTLFSAFSGGYRNVVKTMFRMNLRIFLYSLLLIVPGIIKSYELYLVPYLLAENPHMEADRAMELSTMLMDGEKWNVFALEFSFLGWRILGSLALGLGTYFVLPYEQATYAELYAAMRAKAFALGYSDQQELGDFIRY